MKTQSSATRRIPVIGSMLVAMILIAAATAGAEPAGRAAMPRLPLSFVANAGQLDPGVELAASQDGYSLLLGAAETTMVGAPADREGPPAVVRMRFLGADPAVVIEGRDRLPGVAHFYRGNDPRRWARDVPTFGAAARIDLYPGIDQVYRGVESRWKSELRVAPGADPGQIVMEYSGFESLEIDAEGGLVVSAAGGLWRESAPVAYQEITAERREVPASFRLLGGDRVGFTLGAYDASHQLVIDPTLTFSTYLGGGASDPGFGIAVDSAGNVVVCGNSSSNDFPVLNPAFPARAGGSDFFVARFAADGTLLYSTYLGGSSRELVADVAVDPAGNAYVTGWTTSTDFPTTSGVLGPTAFGVGGTVDDGAVVKLDGGGALIYATYLGGSSDDQAQDIAVDADGHAYVMGHSVSANFPTTPLAYQTVNNGVWDVFVSKLEPDASALVYSTFLGDTGYEEPWALALDGDGNTYVLGRTQSSGFPIVLPALDAGYNGRDTAFLSKLGPAGQNLVYSTFLDGISPRFRTGGFDVAVDAGGHAYVVLPTQGSGFPATPGAYDTTFNGVTDLVVMKISPAADALEFSTYLGGMGIDQGHGIALDGCGGVVLSGFSESADLPLAGSPLPGPGGLGGPRDAFIAHLSADGSNLIYGSFLGGSSRDNASALALGRQGQTCVTGSTVSTDFPTAPAAFPPFQPAFGGGSGDAFATCVEGLLPCSSVERLYTVSDANELMAIDVDNHLPGAPFIATTIGVTRDQAGGPRRSIRGLASVGLTLYGMTREGDLVRVDPATGVTTWVYSLAAGNPTTEFWGGLAFDGIDKLFTANAFDGHELVELTLTPSGPPIERLAGSTTFGTSLRQILGVDFYPASAPAVPPTSNGSHPDSGFLYASNRNNHNVVVLDTANGAVTMPFGNQVAGNNPQAITFHPVSGELYLLHDHYSASNNAALHSYDFTTEMTTELGELPFGIVESVGGGNDTYGWGGLTFAPVCLPPPSTVTCHLFDDIDGDGVQDPGEPGKAGVDVFVTDSQGSTRTVTTDAGGDCSAVVPPGETILDFDDSSLPPGSAWTVGSDPAIVTVPACGSVDVIGGCQQQGTVGCHLFEDLNGDGAQNAGEPDKAGVDVLITDSQGNVLTLTTDAAGNCGATVPAGSTVVDVDDATLPPGTALPPGSDPTSVHVPPGGAAFVVRGCLRTADLAIEKTDGRDSVVAGGLVTYTVRVTNPGPIDVFGATVADAFPGLLGVTWTCTATVGSSCSPSGTGAIADTVDVLAGGTVTYRALGSVDPAATGTLVNVATVDLPPGMVDLDPANNTASDVDAIRSDPCACRRQFTFRAGLMDDFTWPAPPAERAFPSARLRALFPSASFKHFDDPDSNRFFGHTFPSLPAGLLSAVLEVRMRPHSDIPDNDGFGMVVAGGDEKYNTRVKNLPEAHGSWVPSRNPRTVFLLDLGTLTSDLGAPPALLGQVIGDRYLDFRVADDTAVDYVKLHVVFCRSPVSVTRRRGLKDDFALPADPTFRSAALDAQFPGALWKDLDPMTSNRFVGHTFTGLPTQLLSAELEVRMAPHFDIPRNDTLRLGLLASGSFQFGAVIRNLPEAGGSWERTDPPAVFNLDLDPPGVLAQMAADRFLDVMVADDTAVDYLELEMESCSRSRFVGVTAGEVGDGLLIPVAAGALELVGIDGEGDDGLAIDVGEAQGYCLAAESVCLGAEGTALELVATGHVVDFDQSSVTGTLTFADAGGGGVDLSATFSPPFDQFITVEVYLDDAEVADQVVTAGAVARVPEDTCFDELDFLDRCFRVLLSEPAPVTILQGGPTVVGDEIRICRDLIVGLDTVLTELSLTASNLPSLTFTGGALQLFDQLHQPLGAATFQAAGGVLTLADLGTSGDDGVAIELGRAESFDLELVDLDPLDTAASGAFVRARATGSLDGVPDQSLGELTVTRVDAGRGVAGVAFDADFTALGSPSQRVQIFSRGVLVADFPRHTGTAALASDWPIGLGKLGGGTECYVARMPPGTTFSVDGVGFDGDEIRILSEGSSTVDYKSGFEILAAGLGELTIAGETLVPADGGSSVVLFADGFESGDTSAWTAVQD